ncbi:MAG: septum formation initiator family protein [Planctomycetes bacterium]|nr:septum formation initiator family protein [Planctomycetota bacterium]
MSDDDDPGSGCEQRDPARLGGWSWVGVIAVATSAYALCILWPQAQRTETLAERVATLRAEVAEARAAREQLEAEAQALEGDPYAIERALRRRLRYLRPGEQLLAARQPAGRDAATDR